MASAQYYIDQMKSASGISNKTLAQLVAELGGTNNPAVWSYVAPEMRAVVDPRIRTIAEYISQLGAEGYQYDYDTILNGLNAATDQGYENTQQQLANAVAEYNRTLAGQQQTVADTIRNQSAAAIQSGMAKGMQSANLLSTLLGNSQANAEGALQLAQNRVDASNQYAQQLLANRNSALSTSNAAYETLMGNIRQLYNDEIQSKTADLEYNASIQETIANALAQKYAADTNYASNINSAAGNAYNALQAALAQMVTAGTNAEAQDNYAAAIAAQQAAAAAAAAAAQQGYNDAGNDNDDDSPKYDLSVREGKDSANQAAVNKTAAEKGAKTAANQAATYRRATDAANKNYGVQDAGIYDPFKYAYGWVGEK